MQEIRIVCFTDYKSGKTLQRYEIPDNVNPNTGSKAFPETPILIQVLLAGDYSSAIKLLNNSKIDVNVKCTTISKMGENKPSHSTGLMVLVHHITEDSVNTTLPLFSKSLDDALKILHLLLEKGANVNAQDCMGFTALHLLVNNSRIDVKTKSAWIDILLKAGADKTIEMSKYGTAKSLAKLINLDTIQPEVYAKL
jgi:hypothetical protein